MGAEFLELQITYPSKEKAKETARFLVEKGLTMCAQVSRIESTYRWKGEIYDEEEWLLTLKICKDKYKEVERAILENHPYTLPQIIALPIVAGLEPYLEWLRGEE